MCTVARARSGSLHQVAGCQLPVFGLGAVCQLPVFGLGAAILVSTPCTVPVSDVSLYRATLYRCRGLNTGMLCLLHRVGRSHAHTHMSHA